METDVLETLDRLLAPLGRLIDSDSARHLADLKIDPVILARVAVLAERANEGDLTEEERVEYRSYIDAADLLAILQVQARNRLAAAVGT